MPKGPQNDGRYTARYQKTVQPERPAQALKSELRIMQQQLSQEAQKLDKMTIRLPLKRLQREQRHILRHADWLLHYLDSHLADNEGKFFCSCMTWRWIAMIKSWIS